MRATLLLFSVLEFFMALELRTIPEDLKMMKMHFQDDDDSSEDDDTGPCISKFFYHSNCIKIHNCESSLSRMQSSWIIST